MSIHLTQAAVMHVKSVLGNNPQAKGLRLGVKKTGCSGYGYVVDIAKEITPDDKVFEEKGIRVVVKASDLPKFDETEVDFVTEGLSSHFKFNNPKADHYCGCGESFTLKGEDDNGH